MGLGSECKDLEAGERSLAGEDIAGESRALIKNVPLYLFHCNVAQRPNVFLQDLFGCSAKVWVGLDFISTQLDINCYFSIIRLPHPHESRV